VTVEALQDAFEDLQKDASAGVDGVSYADYAGDVHRNLEKLHDRLKQGRYRAQPLALVNKVVLG
jgi:RNA-directed DNA polymerase